MNVWAEREKEGFSIMVGLIRDHEVHQIWFNFFALTLSMA